MFIHYANLRGAEPKAGNFGDELNTWIWPSLLPGIFDDDKSVGFIGIGTVLTTRIEKRFPRTIVFGSGYGFTDPPKHDHTWKFYCVRGHLTAKALGLAPELAIADPGILVNQLFKPSGRKLHKFGFMPHIFEVMGGGDDMFRTACAGQGMHFIDPRWEITDVLEAISSCEILVTAAMHGSIAADALRVPWIPVVTNAGIPELKWTDWCNSVGLDYLPHRIYRFSRLNRYSSKYHHVESQIVSFRLGQIRGRKTYLSTDAIMEQRTSQLMEKIEEFRTDVANGVYATATAQAAI